MNEREFFVALTTPKKCFMTFTLFGLNRKWAEIYVFANFHKTISGNQSRVRKQQHQWDQRQQQVLQLRRQQRLQRQQGNSSD